MPDRDIAFVGDLLFVKAYPVSIDADMLAWRKTLDALAAEPRSLRLVPGHGPICGPDAARERTMYIVGTRGSTLIVAAQRPG